ncbi:hypothetical protein LTR85_007538 [Meristemomyces frigidus]|nr:hypothetical protein LTR85_007538 [Meristemomyces frigidus]
MTNVLPEEPPKDLVHLSIAIHFFAREDTRSQHQILKGYAYGRYGIEAITTANSSEVVRGLIQTLPTSNRFDGGSRKQTGDWAKRKAEGELHKAVAALKVSDAAAGASLEKLVQEELGMSTKPEDFVM